MDNCAKVSIITPTYNSMTYIEKTYESICKQSYSNWEWLVTDDCSSDGTLEILKQLSLHDQRVKVESLTSNAGAAIARNNSLLRVTGEYIAFLDSDDIWLTSKLHNQVKFMCENHIDFSFTAYEVIDECGESIGVKVDTNQTQPLDYFDMLKKKATLGCSTVMIRANKFSKIQMPLIRTGQDYAMWLKILRSGYKAYPLRTVLSQYRLSPNSISRNKVMKAKRQWQIYRKIENIGFLHSCYCFCNYAWRAVFRK